MGVGTAGGGKKWVAAENTVELFIVNKLELRIIYNHKIGVK